MVARALASLKADLAKTAGDDSGSLNSSNELEWKGEENGDELYEPIEEGFEAKPEAKQKEMLEEKQPNKKTRPKKGGSLDSWPEAGGDEEVETFNLGKKS
jgi:hypothetical protein